MNINQSSPYQSNYKQMDLQTPPRSGMLNSQGTEKKEYNMPQDMSEQARSQFHEVAVHKEILSQENDNLKQDVQFWQGKVGHSENEKHAELEFKDQTHRSQMQVLQKTHDDQLDLHTTEINKLTSHLQDRENQNTELASRHQQRCNDIDRLKLDNGSKDAELFKAQREIADLKQIADFKTGENEKLKNHKSELQIQLYQISQSEAALKEETQKQFGQNAALRDTLEKQAVENQQMHSAKDNAHSQQLGALHAQHQNEKDALCGQLQAHQAMISQKEMDIANHRNQLNATTVQLNEVAKNHQNSEVLSKMWQDKHGQSEQDKMIQLENARQAKEATVATLTRNHSIEKSGLQNQISHLGSTLVTREGELNNTKNAYVATEQNRKNLESHKANLEIQLKDWMRKKEEADRSYTNQMKVQNEIHNNQLGAFSKQSEQDKSLLNNQIMGLRQVVVGKEKEVSDHRTNSHMQSIRAAENDKKWRDASQETETWKNHASKIDREKSQEIELAHNLRNSQLADLNRTHSQEMQRQNDQKSALQGVIVSKHSELEQQKVHASQLYSNIQQKDSDIKSHIAEKQVWKSKHEQEAALRQHIHNEAETSKNQLRGIIVDKERAHQDLSSQHNTVSADLYQTQQEAQRRYQEAEAWRVRATDESKQRSIDRATQDEVHRNTTSQMAMSHQSEKDHLHSHISGLHDHVQAKQQESADWRRSYHANRYGKN